MACIINISNESHMRYENPSGYVPREKDLSNGKHISQMKAGMKFIASDGKKYRVWGPVRATHGAGGVVEYDMVARQELDGKLYLFHAPVRVKPLLVTYLLAD